MLDGLVAWMSKFYDAMTGEFLGASSYKLVGVALSLLSSLLLSILVVVSGKTRVESEV